MCLAQDVCANEKHGTDPNTHERQNLTFQNLTLFKISKQWNYSEY